MFLQLFSRILIINVKQMFITCVAMCVYVEIDEFCWKRRFVFSNLLSRVIIFIQSARVVYCSDGSFLNESLM